MSPTSLNSSKTDLPQRPMDFTTWSPRNAALTAGWSLALMAVLGGLSNFGAIVPLIAIGDATETAHNISNAPIQFFAGVVGFLLIAVLDVIVAGALYVVFKPVSRRFSSAAGWMRALYAVLLVAAVSQLVIGFSLLDDPETALPFLESFNTIWVISQGLFGISLVLVGYLAFRSGFVPKVFGILLAIAGIGYLADAIGMAFIPDFSAVFAQFMFVGEVVLIFWLLIAGRRLPAN
ncbi:DUF4386 domain-containing protein [Arthrobacter monumenti]